MMRLVFPGMPVALCIYLIYLAYRRPRALLQHFNFARNSVVLVFVPAFAFSAGVEATYHALLPFLDQDEILKAEQSMGLLNFFDPVWMGTAAIATLIVLYGMRRVSIELQRPGRPRDALKRDSEQ